MHCLCACVKLAPLDYFITERVQQQVGLSNVVQRQVEKQEAATDGAECIAAAFPKQCSELPWDLIASQAGVPALKPFPSLT